MLAHKHNGRSYLELLGELMYREAMKGKASFSEDKLVENIKAFADAVSKAKPSGAKGTYIQRVAVSSTMGPGVKVDPSSVLNG